MYFKDLIASQYFYTITKKIIQFYICFCESNPYARDCLNNLAANFTIMSFKVQMLGIDTTCHGIAFLYTV